MSDGAEDRYSSPLPSPLRSSPPPPPRTIPTVPPPAPAPAPVGGNGAAPGPVAPTESRPSLSGDGKADDRRSSLSLVGTPPAAAAIGSAEVEARDAFEEQLSREILGAERFRALLLASIPTIILFALVVVRGAYPDVVVSLLHGNFDIAPVGLFLMVVAIFEFAMLASVRRQRLRGERPSALRRYSQALLETSIPTAVVLYYAAVDGPVQALLMPSTFVYFIFILLSTLRLDFTLSAFTGLVAAGEYALIAVVWGSTDVRLGESLASFPHHLGKAAILLVSGVAAGFVAQRLRRSFTRAIESVGERQRILGVFGQHVSPEVVARLVAGKTEVRSELREVCVMFLDIRNFTAFAESKSPSEVVDYLNTVFESTIAAVVSHHGIVNKFLGDGFMALFGAPIAEGESCASAVDAALDIVARVEALVTEGKIPPTKLGIGLHAGRAVVGNIGSAQRKEYTVIGDVVNVASRIEALNKELGSTVLASDEVYRGSGRTDLNATPREDVAIRGRSQAVKIWQLV